MVLVLLTALVGYGVSKYKDWSAAKKAADLEEKRLAKAERDDAEKERRTGIADAHQQLVSRVELLEKKDTEDAQTLALLKQDMLPIIEATKRKLIEVLTHPSDGFKIPDDLLKRVIPTGAVMPPELLPILKARETSTDKHVSELEKLAAKALPIITELAALEAKEVQKEITSVQLVTSTNTTPETKRKEEGAT